MNSSANGAPNRPSSSPPPPRPGLTGPMPRLGVRSVEYLQPAHDDIVRIDLRLIGAPLYDLLDIQVVDFDPHDIAPLIKTVETDRERAAHLRQQADRCWQTQIWKGAVQVYPWNDSVLSAVQTRFNLLHREPVAIRVTDPLLAINLLGRARGSLLLPHAPLALERKYLEHSIACDDPRIIRLALDAGCTFAPLVDAPPESDEMTIEDDSA